MLNLRPVGLVLSITFGNVCILAALMWTGWDTHPLLTALVAAIFGVPAIATYWMIYDAVRYEKRPWPYIVLAFVPYLFIWHYFERVRKRGPLERRPVGSR